jgi:hypothetical protein
MAHIVDEMQAAAAKAVGAMREIAIVARRMHARAELMRHMRLTARKVAQKPLDEAVRLVSEEWMQAWGLGEEAYKGLAEPLRGYTEAFCRDAREPSEISEAAIATASVTLEKAFEEKGTTLADEMAFRSGCAHCWWEMVVPVPEKLRRERPGMPRWQAGRPFWETGAAPHCLEG